MSCHRLIYGVLLFVALASSAKSVELAESVATASTTRTFERTFFGMHVLRPFQNTMWREAGQGSIRLHDLNVAWRDLEPQKGAWQWRQLDEAVKVALQANADVVLPLQSTPTWAATATSAPAAYGLGSANSPRESADWENYVAQVVQRYRGRIAYYEMWNEPNIKKFFNGSPAELADLTVRAAKIIRKIDPNAKVVCAGITGQYGLPWFDAYLAAGAGEACDIIGYHLYTGHDRPEVMRKLVSGIRQVMTKRNVATKPLWNTESGWLIGYKEAIDARSAGFDEKARVLTPETAAEYVIRSLLVARALDVERFYWYAWDHPQMGLTSNRGVNATAVSKTYSATIELLVGAVLEACVSQGGRWVCTVKKGGVRDDYYWAEQGDSEGTVKVAGDRFEFDVNGGMNRIDTVVAGQRLKLTGRPFIVRSTVK